MRADAEALQYLRDASARMATADPDDCVVHACRVAEELLRVGESPWIGSIRDVSIVNEQEFHHPLVPLRFRGRPRVPAWSVHYICCNEGAAYDPLIGEPVPIDELAMRVFGREVALREAVSAAKVRELGSADALRAHVRTLRFRF
jgi:hypothetical protein